MGCDQLTSLDTTTQTTEITTTFLETTVYSEDDTYLERNYSEFSDLHITEPSAQLSQEQDRYYIYYYGPYCEHCIFIKNEVLSKIELLKNDVVYLVEVNSPSDINENILVKYTPSLVRIESTEAKDNYVGATAILNILNGLS